MVLVVDILNADKKIQLPRLSRDHVALKDLKECMITIYYLPQSVCIPNLRYLPPLKKMYKEPKKLQN